MNVRSGVRLALAHRRRRRLLSAGRLRSSRRRSPPEPAHCGGRPAWSIDQANVMVFLEGRCDDAHAGQLTLQLSDIIRKRTVPFGADHRIAVDEGCVECL